MVVDYVWLNLCYSKEAAIGSVVYSYKHGFSGFAARLRISSQLPGVAHVMPSSFHTLQNTRSRDYLGLSSHSPTNLMHDTKMGDGIVIGIIDSGTWPESKMLNYEGVANPNLLEGSVQIRSNF
ncbi:hypothetical protein GBA52_016963 [Prunus armeniaca]|nr:hypothetical protein GBA52_016963 [Prunus armeniaca]